MIKIFRNIRFNLLKENKIVRYLFYAIGEILLVIIGILLALNINNKNELRKQEKETVKILKQIQTDLEISIEEIDDVIEYYRAKDSLIYLVLNDQVTYDDYIDPNNFRLSNIMYNWRRVTIFDDGFNKLMNHIDNLPPQYESIIPFLNKVYIKDKDMLYKIQDRMGDMAYGAISYLRENKKWFLGWSFTENSRDIDEAYKYFLSDSLYKNRLSFWSMLVSQNFTARAFDIRTDAIRGYQQISKLMANEYDEGRNNPLFSNDTSDYSRYVGLYVDDQDTVEIKLVENHLFYDVYGNEQSEIFFMSDINFYCETRSGFYYFQKDEEGEVNSYTLRRGPTNRVFNKIY